MAEGGRIRKRRKRVAVGVRRRRKGVEVRGFEEGERK